MDNNTLKICCICGLCFEGFGNNPWPVVDSENAVCCDDCDSLVVLPERWKIAIKRHEAKKAQL